MSRPVNLALVAGGVVGKSDSFALLMDRVRTEAAKQLELALDGVSGKKMDYAGFPFVGRRGISRAINGCASNPLYRIIGVFVLMKRLGLTRDRAQRIVNFLQEMVDEIWPPDEEEDPKEVLLREQQLDLADDEPQLRLAWGEPGAAAQMLEAVRAQHAHAPAVIRVLRRLVAAEQQR